MVSGGVAYDMMGYLVEAGAPVETLADFQAYNNEMPERRIPNGQYQIDQAVPQIEAGLTREIYEQVAVDAQAALAATLDATFEETGAEILVSMGNEHSSYYALAGYPAITVPLGLRANGGPTGVTFIGKPGTDAQLLAYAYAFEQASMLRETPDLEAVMEQLDSGAAATAAEVDSMAGLGDPLYPGLGNAGYDVQHYTIDLDVDMETGGIDGSTTIDSLAEEELSAFNLDFSGLDIAEITVDGAPADFSREGTELIITPASPIADGAAFITAVTYSGVPEPIVDPGVPFTPVGWLSFPEANVISVISQPSGAMSWFPSNNHQLDKATYTISVNVDNPYVVAANGVLADVTEEGDNSTYTWEMDAPMATYLATVNIGEFERDESEGPDGIALRNYYPAGRVDEFAPAFEPTAEMIEFFSSFLGPFPYDVYGAVVLPVEGEFALETQTMSVFPESSVSEEVIAHELMHHWIGNDLSPATWQDIWLNEGFSQYFPFLWDEHINGPDNINAAMQAYYEYVAGAQLAPPATVPVVGLFSEPIYIRGATTLHALRLEVGDETFFEIMRTYYERFAGSTASTQDFIDVAVEVGGDELADFLNGWLYEEEVPAWPGS
jgi:aminopeptidase N